MNKHRSSFLSCQASLLCNYAVRNCVVLPVFSALLLASSLVALPGSLAKADSDSSTPDCCAPSKKALPMLKINDHAPDFTLPSQAGEPVKLSGFLDKSIVVVYFYPKDFTAICTNECKAFRDSYEAFKQAGAEVIGISADSVESHKSFADEHHLPFILLSDSDNHVRKLWRVPNSLGFLPGRVTYVVDKKGIIRGVFNAPLEDKKHVTQALKVIEDLKKEHVPKS